MFPEMIRRIKHLAGRKTGVHGERLSVSLDRDSIDRFKRLKKKLKSVNEGQLMALALKSLEQKTDRIIKRQARKKAPLLLKEGLGMEEIAKHFEKKGIPAPGEAAHWDTQAVSDVLDTNRDNRMRQRFQGQNAQRSVTG